MGLRDKIKNAKISPFGWRDTIDKAIDKITPIIDQAVVDKDAAFQAKFELEQMRTQLMLSTGNFSITKWTICALVSLVVGVGSYMFITDFKTMEAFKDYVLAVTPVIGILIGAYGTGKMFKNSKWSV